MKILLATSLIFLSLNSQAEFLQVSGVAVKESHSETATTCDYKSVNFTADYNDVAKIAFFVNLRPSLGWTKVNFTYTNLGAERVQLTYKSPLLTLPKNSTCPAMHLEIHK